MLRKSIMSHKQVNVSQEQIKKDIYFYFKSQLSSRLFPGLNTPPVAGVSNVVFKSLKMCYLLFLTFNFLTYSLNFLSVFLLIKFSVISIGLTHLCHISTNCLAWYKLVYRCIQPLLCSQKFRKTGNQSQLSPIAITVSEYIHSAFIQYILVLKAITFNPLKTISDFFLKLFVLKKIQCNTFISEYNIIPCVLIFPLLLCFSL